MAGVGVCCFVLVEQRRHVAMLLDDRDHLKATVEIT